MDTGKAALIFFFGLFWASALSGIAEFRPFDTAAWFRPNGLWRGVRRFVAGVFIADVLPLIGLWCLYTTDAIVPSDVTGPTTIFAAAVASLGVFAVPRLMHAVLATAPLYKHFYFYADWQRVVDEAGASQRDSFWAHFLPGLGYLVGFPLAAWGLIRCFGS